MARRIETLFVRYRRRGDVAALGRVFDIAAPEVLRVAMHFARHPAEAEDLLQETFLTAIGRAEAYDADRPLIPWLIGILRNHAQRLHRQRRRLARAIEAAGDDQAHEEPWMDVAWCDNVAAAVEALSDPYRQVLVLKLRHDKSPAEIAVLLDVPPATVRSQIHRGLERLRERLDPETRARTTAALPVGAGLTGIREQVLSHGSQVAGTTAAATVTLPLIVGGLIMTKKSVLVAVVLLAGVVLGTGAWINGVFDPDDLDAGKEGMMARGSALGEPDDSGKESPVLVGTGAPDEDLPAAPPVTIQERPAAESWPPELEIPEDKGSVAGTIRFEDGSPLVGAKVALWGTPHVIAETDEQGRYHIHADWVHGRALFLRLGRVDEPTHLRLILSSEVAMQNGKLVTRDLTLQRGLEVASTVVDGHSGDPIADAKVTLRQEPRGPGQASSGFGLTDERGRFAFPYVPRGTYSIELEAKGYEASVTGYDLANEDLPGELELLRSRPLVIQFVNLPEGAIGTQVSFHLSRTDTAYLSVTTKPEIAADGTLRVDAPAAGPYRLTLFESSHLPRLERDIVIPKGPLDTIVWTLAQGARVVGTLLDAQGAPIADARVDFGRTSGRSKTDAEGHFELPYVPAGKRSLRVYAGTGWIRFAVVDVPTEGTARFDLRAPGSSTLKGRFQVGDLAVDRYSGQLKFVDVATKQEVATTRTDATGGFEVPLLPAGEYEVRAWATGGIPRTISVEIARGQTKDLGTIGLVPFEKVPVRFVLPDGKRAPANIPILVRAYNPKHALPARVPSSVEAAGSTMHVSPRIQHDAVGRTWVSGLTQGRHRLEFMPAGYERVSLEVDVKPGMTAPIEIRLDPKEKGGKMRR